MGLEWRTVTVGEFAPFTYGKGLPANKRNSIGRVPVFGSNGIVGYHDSALTDGPTIIIGRKGTAGAVHYSPIPCWPIDTTFFVTDRDASLLRFKYYALRTLGLEHMNSDSAVPGLNRDAAHARELRVLKESEQRAIAHILGTLDDKIELNRRMNETLAAMAQTVFQSWFVNFDPVIDNALAAGNPIPEALQSRAKIRQSILNGTAERNGYESLPDSIRQLFPSAFEYTEEIGYIPKGWKVGVLDDMIELLSGGTPRTSVAQYWDGNIPWYTAKDAPSLSDIFVIETERKITRAGVENSATKILPAGITVITARGTVGRLACLGIPMAMNQTCYGIRGTDSYPDYFTYWNIRMTVDELQQRTHGTIFDTITRHTFQLVDTIIPPLKLADTFETAVQPIMNRILSNLQESRTLATVRDTLLPKLIAGELRLREVEKLLDLTNKSRDADLKAQIEQRLQEL